MTDDCHQRVFGLDLMRAVAVLLVVFGHMLQHSHPPDCLKYFGRLGVLGVEIFFVLSGFLIGGIIIDLIKKNRFETLRDLLGFWSRRWLRTLPLYYLFFFIYLSYDWTGPSRLRDHLEFLVFLQNFAWRGPDFFLLSWSLTIEEYFYLLFPLLFLFIHRRWRDPVRSMAATIGIFVIVPFLIKLFRAPYPDWDAFNFQLRMVTIARLDSLMYGVCAVFIKNFFPAVWMSIQRFTRQSAMFGVGISLYIYAGVPGLETSYIIQTLFFPVISLAVALMLPTFDGMRDKRTGLWKRLVTHISTVSYSVYLGHILVLTLVNNALGKLPGGMSQIYAYPTRLYPIYLVFILLLTPMTYYAWERPFLKLRDRQRASRKSSEVEWPVAHAQLASQSRPV